MSKGIFRTGKDNGEPLLNEANSSSSELSALLCAVLAVERDYITLRDSSGWLLWSGKITTAISLDEIIKKAKYNIGYKQGT